MLSSYPRISPFTPPFTPRHALPKPVSTVTPSALTLLARRRPFGNESPSHGVEPNQLPKGETRVFALNFPWQTAQVELQQFMEQSGEVVSCEIQMTLDGRSKGCAIVEYASPASAAHACQTLSSQIFNGRRIFVREDREPTSDYGSQPILYVGNLPNRFRWQELKDLFRDYGGVTRADIPLDSRSGLPRSWGYVVLEDAETARRAIDALDGWLAGTAGEKLVVLPWDERPEHARDVDPLARRDARRLEAREMGKGTFDSGRRTFGEGVFAGELGRGEVRTPQRFDYPPHKQLVVRNLPWQTDDTDLITLFESNGSDVVRAEMLFDGGRSRGIGMVEFASEQIAQNAIDAFNLYEYGGRQIRVHFVNNPHTFSSMALRGLKNENPPVRGED